MYDVTALGEVLIDLTPAGKSENGNVLFERNPGGAPANVLALLAKFGKKTAFIGKVGCDAFGTFLSDTLKDSGIDTSGLLFTDQANTTLAFVHLNDDGDRSFSFYRKPGADMMLEANEVPAPLIEQSKIFHFGSISMTHEPAESATIKAVELAKANGALISFDPNLRIPLWSDLSYAKEKITRGLAFADIVKLSEEELEFITGTNDLFEGTQYIAEHYGITLIFVTLAEKGCFYRYGKFAGTVTGYKVDTVDTTGAGDSFIGGMLYRLLEKDCRLNGLSEGELREMIAFANAVGALTTTKKGAIPAMPHIDDVRKLMSASGSPVVFQEPYRPQFHYSPEANWLNDPNGMVYYEGEYHLFYQYHPGSTVWGPMHWGHAVSRDLVHWEHFPIGLYPDENGFIFSGSAVVDWKDTSGFFNGGHGLVAIFTHADEYPGSDRPRQRQSLAFSSDKGRTWTKYEGNPVLADESITDFRDPKVFWHDRTGRWVMLLAVQDRVHIYTSADLKSWSFASEFGAEAGAHDGVWECPDLFELPVQGVPGVRKWVMIVSLNPTSWGSCTQYFIGDFDGVTFTNDNPDDKTLWFDPGRDNYAGVTWSDIPERDGRRILIGWMSNWNYARVTPSSAWKGATTVPRVLTLSLESEGVRIVQTPVDELKQLRGEPLEWNNIALAPGVDPLSGVYGDAYELVAEFELGTATEFGFKIRKSDKEETVVGYNTADESVFIDRTSSGIVDFDEDFACRHSAGLIPENNRIRLRLFVDWSSVEVFANGGKLVMTDQIFPDPESRGMELYAAGGEVTLVSLKLYPLQSIHSSSRACICEAPAKV